MISKKTTWLVISRSRKEKPYRRAAEKAMKYYVDNMSTLSHVQWNEKTFDGYNFAARIMDLYTGDNEILMYDWN